MRNFKLITVDLDGTLLDNQCRVSESNLSAISSLSNKGIFVVPCTGRTLAEIPESLKNNKDIRYIIHSTGSVILDTFTNQKVLNCISKDIAQEIFKVLSDFDVHIAIRHNGFCHVQTGTTDKKSIEYYNIFFGHEDIIRNFAKKVDDFAEWKHSIDNIEAFAIFFHDLEKREECKKRLEKINGLSLAFVSDYNIEILSHNSGKGNAVKNLLKMLNIEKEHSLGLGDSRNDLPMMQAVGTPVAVSNATDAIKSYCKEIICSNQENAIEYLYNNYVK